MSILDTLNKAADGLYELFRGPASSYCRLEGLDDELTLCADDGSLVSAFSVEGTLAPPSDALSLKAAAALSEKTRSLFERGGHFVKAVFDYRPDGGGEAVRGALAPSRRAAADCGLDLGRVLDGWEAALGAACGEESLTVVLWTTLAALPPAERRRAARDFAEASADGILAGAAELRSAHKGAASALSEGLGAAGLLSAPLPGRRLAREIRAALYGPSVPRSWTPALPWDRIPLLEPDGTDSRPGVYPSLKSQIFPGPCVVREREFLLAGERLHAPFFLSLPPRDPKPFSRLFAALSSRKPRLPLRMAVSLSPGGLEGLAARGTLARILSFTSRDDRQLASAIDGVKAMAEGGVAVCGISFACDTDTDVGDHRDVADAVRALRRRRGELARLVSGWGEAGCQECAGDPLLGVAAALPGLMPHGGPAARAAAPLEEAWGFMPARPASPWREGPLVLRTFDGKPMPFAHNSSVQAAWVDLGIAPMGAGKSVLLNTLNLAFILQAGARRLPLLSIIDVGPSSRGLIDLARSALPASRRHEAAFLRVRGGPETAVNPFDTPLGFRFPLPAQLSFLENLLTLLCSPLGAPPPPGTGGLVRLAVEGAYLELARRPRLLTPDLDPDLYGFTLAQGFPLDRASSVWEAVDFLFGRGMIHEASLWQRHAVPTLRDAAARARTDDAARAAYGYAVAGTGERLCAYVWRALSEAVKDYPALSRATCLSLGDARVVALDLDECAPRGGGPAGDRRAAVMYMLARHLCGARFFMMPEDALLAPPAYRDHHAGLIDEIRREPKRLCYDELHRVTGEPAVRAQLAGDLESCARESRKWNLSVGLYSQSLADFPEVFLDLATSVFLPGAGSASGLERVARAFGLDGGFSAALARIGKPGPDGAGFGALFKTSAGPSAQLLKSTLSPELLWAFSTTAEDAHVRSALYARFGVERTLGYLSRRWPAGLKAEVERRKAMEEDSGNPGTGRGAVPDLIDELASAMAAEAAR
jgi:intracellular multiplication protein IcmB